MANAATAPIRRLTFEDVLAMVEAGILGETDRVELENGVLIEMEPASGAHGSRVTWLNMHFARSVPEGFVVRVQDSFLTPDGGFYEPDIVVCRNIGAAVPTTADLVIEVAVTSRPRDRQKAATYALAGVREYWIVDVTHGEVAVHREPVGARYTVVLGHDSGTLTPPVPAADVDVPALLRGL